MSNSKKSLTYPEEWSNYHPSRNPSERKWGIPDEMGISAPAHPNQVVDKWHQLLRKRKPRQRYDTPVMEPVGGKLVDMGELTGKDIEVESVKFKTEGREYTVRVLDTDEVLKVSEEKIDLGLSPRNELERRIWMFLPETRYPVPGHSWKSDFWWKNFGRYQSG